MRLCFSDFILIELLSHVLDIFCAYMIYLLVELSQILPTYLGYNGNVRISGSETIIQMSTLEGYVFTQTKYIHLRKNFT